MAERIFLLEDDINFGSILKAYLEMHEFEIIWETDGAKALDIFLSGTFNICILDVMLPHRDGFSVAAQIRKKNEQVPIIFLTAKTLREDVLKGFKAGADDYITKPFDSEVLLYKLRAILKRGMKTPENPDGFYRIASYEFDHKLRVLRFEDREQHLSPREADLLKMLCDHKNEVMPRTQALREIWGNDDYFTTRSMDVYISKLRKYLSEDSRIEISNIHGSGFRLLCPDG